MKKYALSIFYVLCGLEGLLVLGTFKDEKGNLSVLSLMDNSPFRLGLIFFILLVSSFFFIMAIKEWRAGSNRPSPTRKLIAHQSMILLGFIFFIIGVSVLYLSAFSPVAHERVSGYFTRWKPIFLWGILVFIQFFLLIILTEGKSYWKNAWENLEQNSAITKIRKHTNAAAGGYALLITAFLIGLTKIYFGRFVDEADNMTVGWLITEGYSLYGDVFSHHFPFPYYWVALIVGIFGNSFVIIRISVLLLQTLLFAASMRISGFYMAIGLTSLVWNMINQFHRGQEVIYATFAGIFMAVILIIIFSLLVKKIAASKLTLVLLGILLGLALLTDPLMIYAVVIAVAGLFFSGVFANLEAAIVKESAEVLWVGLAAALIFTVFALSLLISGTAEDFYHDAVLFNSQVYSKYIDAQPFSMTGIIENLVSGLNISDGRWFHALSPFIPMDAYRSVSLDDENLYHTWVFSSFLFRMSILTCMVGLFLNRKITAGIFLYIYSAALLVRADQGIYAIGFVLVSLFAAFYLLVELRKPVLLKDNASQPTKLPGSLRFIARYAWLAVLVVIGTMLVWSAFRGAYFITSNWFDITNDNHIKQYVSFGDDIHQVSCNQEGVELSIFPINPIIHFVTEIPPASRYTWMYPWVAEVGQEQLIEELGVNSSAVVWIQQGRKRDSPEGVTVYMSETIDFLDENYIRFRSNYWMSPQLAEICSIEPIEIPTDQTTENE